MNGINDDYRLIGTDRTWNVEPTTRRPLNLSVTRAKRPAKSRIHQVRAPESDRTHEEGVSKVDVFALLCHRHLVPADRWCACERDHQDFPSRWELVSNQKQLETTALDKYHQELKMKVSQRMKNSTACLKTEGWSNINNKAVVHHMAVSPGCSLYLSTVQTVNKYAITESLPKMLTAYKTRL